MYLPNKKSKKNKRRYLQPCKYNEMANLDLEKIRLERYFVPVPLDVEGAAGKGKLDKKMVEVEEDISDFYLNSRMHWRSPSSGASKADFCGLFKYDYQYSSENREKEEGSYQDYFLM